MTEVCQLFSRSNPESKNSILNKLESLSPRESHIFSISKLENVQLEENKPNPEDIAYSSTPVQLQIVYLNSKFNDTMYSSYQLLLEKKQKNKSQRLTPCERFCENLEAIRMLLSSCNGNMQMCLDLMENCPYSDIPGSTVVLTILIKLLLEDEFINRHATQRISSCLLELISSFKNLDEVTAKYDIQLRRIDKNFKKCVQNLGKSDSNFADKILRVVETEFNSIHCRGKNAGVPNQIHLLITTNSQGTQFVATVHQIQIPFTELSLNAKLSLESSLIGNLISVIDEIKEQLVPILTLIFPKILKELKKNKISVKEIKKLDHTEKLDLLKAASNFLTCLGVNTALHNKLTSTKKKLNELLEGFGIIFSNTDNYGNVTARIYNSDTLRPSSIYGVRAIKKLRQSLISSEITDYVPSTAIQYLIYDAVFKEVDATDPIRTHYGTLDGELKRFREQLCKSINEVDASVQVDPLELNPPTEEEKIFQHLEVLINDYEKIILEKIWNLMKVINLPNATFAVRKDWIGDSPTTNFPKEPIGHFEATCYFIGLAATKITFDSASPNHKGNIKALRKKFFNLTSDLAKLLDDGTNLTSKLSRKVILELALLEQNSQYEIEKVYGETAANFSSIFNSSSSAELDLEVLWSQSQTPNVTVEESKNLQLTWSETNPGKFYCETNGVTFEYANLSQRSELKLIHELLDHLLIIISQARKFMDQLKSELSHSKRKLNALNTYFLNLEKTASIRPEQIVGLLSAIYSRMLNAYYFLLMLERVYKRSRYSLSFAIRSIRNKIGDVDFVPEELPSNPFHYHDLRIELPIDKSFMITASRTQSKFLLDDIKSKSDMPKLVEKFEEFEEKIKTLGKLMSLTLFEVWNDMNCQNFTENKENSSRMLSYGLIIGISLMEIKHYNEITPNSAKLFIETLQDIDSNIESIIGKENKSIGKKILFKLKDIEHLHSHIMQKYGKQKICNYNDETLLTETIKDTEKQNAENLWEISIHPKSKILLKRRTTKESFRFGFLNTRKQFSIIEEILKDLNMEIEKIVEKMSTDILNNLKTVYQKLTQIKRELKGTSHNITSAIDAMSKLKQNIDSSFQTLQFIYIELSKLHKAIHCIQSYMKLKFTPPVIVEGSTNAPVNASKKKSKAELRKLSQLERGGISGNCETKLLEIEDYFGNYAETFAQVKMDFNSLIFSGAFLWLVLFPIAFLHAFHF